MLILKQSKLKNKIQITNYLLIDIIYLIINVYLFIIAETIQLIKGFVFSKSF